MTTTTSNHGARLQRDKRLQPTPKPSHKGAHSATPLPRHVAPKRSASTSYRRKKTEISYRKSAVPAKFKAKFEPPTKLDRPSRPSVKAKEKAATSSDTKIAPTRKKQSLYELFATPVAYLAGVAALILGWLYRDTRDLNAESGLGYLLGVVAVFCMVTLLVYPVRKRFRLLRFIGSVKNWFRTHMMLGALGPIAALYHCNFQLGSLNSQVALYSALLVAGSGLVGRVLYQKMNQNLYGSKTDFNQLRKSLQANTPQLSNSLTFLPLVASRIGAFDQRILDSGKRLWPSIKILPGLARKARREKTVLLTFTDQQLGKIARKSPVIRAHQSRLSAVLDRYLYLHMAQARRLARLQLYERLFALWHLVHLPFFFMLVISTAVHVLAVHLY